MCVCVCASLESGGGNRACRCEGNRINTGVRCDKSETKVQAFVWDRLKGLSVGKRAVMGVKNAGGGDRRNDEAARLRSALMNNEANETEEEYDACLLMRTYAYLMCEKQQMKRAEIIAHLKKRDTTRRVLREALSGGSSNDDEDDSDALSTSIPSIHDAHERTTHRSKDTDYAKRVSAALTLVCGGDLRLSQLPEEEDMKILKDGLRVIMKEAGCARLRAAVLETTRRFLLRAKTSGDAYVREYARIVRWKERAPSPVAANAAAAAHEACIGRFRAMVSFLSWLEDETIGAMRCERSNDAYADPNVCDDIQSQREMEQEGIDATDASNGRIRTEESVHYERRILAVSMYEAMLDAGVSAKQTRVLWVLSPSSEYVQCPEASTTTDAKTGTEASSAAILALASDAHDDVRSMAIRCLEFFEYPLPCLADVHTVQAYVDAGFARMCSDKARDAEQGVEMVALIYCKYVLKLDGWKMRLIDTSSSSSSSSSSSPPLIQGLDRDHTAESNGMQTQRWRLVVDVVAPTEKTGASHVSLFEDLLRCVASEIARGAEDTENVGEVCGTETSMMPLHGLLQLTRRILITSWTLWTSQSKQQTEVDCTIGGAAAIQGLLRVVQTVMRVVVDVVGQPEAVGMSADDVVACEHEENELVLGEPQRIISISWNAMKECFMCIAAAAECSLPVAHADARVVHTPLAAQYPAETLETAFVEIGNVMLEMLLVMKHNGALDYAYRGLASLGEAMLRCGGSLALEPARWLQFALAQMQRDGQMRQDVVRRSAGLPFALLAIFVAERDAAAPCLRGRTATRRMRRDISGDVVQHAARVNGSDKTQAREGQLGPPPLKRVLLEDGMRALLEIAAATSPTSSTATRVDYETDNGIRGVAPRIHAFNALHKICTCRKLATCIGDKLEDVYRICVDANATCRVREVRVAAMLAFAGMLERMVGYKNLPSAQQEWGAARAMSDDRFFIRFPKMHTYMESEIDAKLGILEAEYTDAPTATATPQMMSTTCTSAVNALVMHLALIGRLEPRPGGPLHAFAPLVARCTLLKIDSITRMAARCPV